MYKNKKKEAREVRAKLLFLFIKYAKFVALWPLSRCRSQTRYTVNINHLRKSDEQSGNCEAFGNRMQPKRIHDA